MPVRIINLTGTRNEELLKLKKVAGGGKGWTTYVFSKMVAHLRK